jgi:hypothetical protein
LRITISVYSSEPVGGSTTIPLFSAELVGSWAVPMSVVCADAALAPVSARVSDVAREEHCEAWPKSG